VLAIGGWLVDIWGPWCQDARVVVAGRIDFVAEVMLDGGGECDIMVAVGGGVALGMWYSCDGGGLALV
jgi:hypothetical protein